MVRKDIVEEMEKKKFNGGGNLNEDGTELEFSKGRHVCTHHTLDFGSW